MLPLPHLIISVASILLHLIISTHEQALPDNLGLGCEELDIGLYCWITSDETDDATHVSITKKDLIWLDCSFKDATEYVNLLDAYHFDVHTISKFSSKECNLTSLEQLRPLTNLTELILNKESVKELIPGMNLLKLNSFNLANSLLTFIHPEAFIGLTQLESIELSSNQITKLPVKVFQSLVNLTTLALFNNNLTSIEGVFDRLDSLSHLNLRANSIEVITYETFIYSRQLKSLDLSMNKIREIHETAFLSNYNLRDVQLAYNKVPIDLRLFIEQITTDPSYSFRAKSMYKSVENKQRLVIELDENNITALDLTGLYKIPSLTLKLGYSNITSMKTIKLPLDTDIIIDVLGSLTDAQMFQDLLNVPSVKHIQAASNRVLMNFDDWDFKGEYIERLNLDLCQIQSFNLMKVIRNFPKLEYFSLTSNRYQNCFELIGSYKMLNTTASPNQVKFIIDGRSITCFIEELFVKDVKF